MDGEESLRTLTFAAFRFVVDVANQRQGAFTECSLPSIEWDMEDLKEGGLNTYVHQLIGARKPARLTLKNGVGKSELLNWYLEAMGEKVTRKQVTITLLDSLQQPVMVWHIEGAYPLKWTGPQLKTDANTIAIQTLELVCGEITVKS